MGAWVSWWWWSKVQTASSLEDTTCSKYVAPSSHDPRDRDNTSRLPSPVFIKYY